MNAPPPARRLIDDYHFHLARTELINPGDEVPESPVSPQSPATSDAERLDRAVRDYAFSGTARGHGIAVSYSFDPGGTGTIVFKWRILLDKKCEPTLVVLRNGKKFREESGRMAGEFPDVLVRNERIQFCFGLIVGRRELDRPAICELIAPLFKAAEPTKSTEARRAERDAWKQQAKEKAMSYHAKMGDGNPETLKLRLSEIDEEGRQKFGEF